MCFMKLYQKEKQIGKYYTIYFRHKLDTTKYYFTFDSIINLFTTKFKFQTKYQLVIEIKFMVNN